MRRFLRSIFTVLVGVGSLGCQSQSAPPGNPPTPQAAPAGAPASTPQNVPEIPAPATSPAKPESPPVQAVRTVLEGVEAGRLDVIADFLPASFQSDVEALVRTAAEKIPADLWARLQPLAEKTARLLQKHPHLGATAETTKSVDDTEFQAKLTAALEALSDPKNWDRAVWQQFELKSFLKGQGSAVFTAWQNLMATKSSLLTETQVTLLELDGDQAKLTFQSPLEPEPRVVEFVHLEDKWIPKSLADNWQETVRNSRTNIEKLGPEHLAEISARLQPKLLQIERTLDQMLIAERAEQVQLGWWQIQSLWVQARQEWVGNGPPPRVEIHLAGDVSDDELTALLDQLIQAADQPDAAEYVTFPTSTGISIQLSPVADLSAFVPRLTFLTVTSQSDTERSIDVQWNKKSANEEPETKE